MGAQQALTPPPPPPGQKLKFLFAGATFHIPLTKSATLNRLLHCSLWQFSGALFYFRGLFFAFWGRNRPEPLCKFPPAPPPPPNLIDYVFFGGGGLYQNAVKCERASKTLQLPGPLSGPWIPAVRYFAIQSSLIVCALLHPPK